MRGLISILSVLVWLSLYSLSYSGVPKEGWYRVLGGSGHDEGLSVQVTPDGGFIIAGLTDRNGDMDAYVVKLDGGGKEVWERTFGGKGDDEALSIAVVRDGGYILAGWTRSFGEGASDVYVVRMDEKGERLWERTFGGRGEDFATFVAETSDGGFLVVGVTESLGAGGYDAYVLKLDRGGNLLWERAYGGIYEDEALSACESPDGFYIVAGVTKSLDAGDIYIFKLDGNGNKLWERNYGGDRYDDATSVIGTDDGGYIVAGLTYSFGSGKGDVYILKIDDSGNKVWDRVFGGPDEDGALSIERFDFGYVISGWTSSFGQGKSDLYLIGMDKGGRKLWERTFGGKGDEKGFSIRRAKDGGIVVVGVTESFGSGYDVYVLKLTSPR